MSIKKEYQYRSATQEEMPQFTTLMKYAFTEQDNSEPDDADTDNMFIPDWTLCAFDNKTMVASSATFPFKIRFNGSTLAAAGISAVTANPGYRRQGLVRELMTRTLIDQHEKNVPAAILWASMGAIYQRFGYGLASSHVKYSLNPRFGSFQENIPANGTVRLVDREEALPIIKDIYRNYSKDRNLLIQRADRMWDIMLPKNGRNKQYIAIFTNDNGKPTAYSLYSTKMQPSPTPGPDQVLSVIDFCWLDINGYRGMWEYLCAHDLVNMIEWNAVPEDDPAPGLLLEPRMLQRRTFDGIWLRVIDVQASLAIRNYNVDGEVIISVPADDLCPWNTGVYRLTSNAGFCDVEKLNQSADIDFEVSPQGIASLLSGHGKASWLNRIGRLNALRPERLELIDSLFSTKYQPTCANDF